jgi:hypothetical protein
MDAASIESLIKDWVFCALAVIFFGASLYLLLFERAAASAGIAVIAAVFCALMGNPDRFQSMKFSLSGVETKAREVIQQAEVSQQQFRKLAAMTGELIVELDASSGRWYSGNPAFRIARKTELLTTLKSLGLTDTELQAVKAADKKWVIIDYIGMIIQYETAAIPNSESNRQEALRAVVADFTGNGIEQMITITPEKLRTSAEKLGVLTDNVQGLITDLDYYLKTGEHRRPEVWAQHN